MGPDQESFPSGRRRRIAIRDWHGGPWHLIEDKRGRDFGRLVDDFLRDLSRGISRIQNGEIPDGSGTPIPVDPGSDTLDDYLFLPGRAGGQTVHAIDTAPSVIFDSLAVGNPNIRFTVAGTTIMEVGPEANGSGTDLAWTGTAGWQVRAGDNTSGIRVTTATGRAFLQSGILSGGVIQASEMTLGGMNATVGDRLSTEYQRIAIDNTGTVGSGGAGVTAHTTRLGVNVDPYHFRNSAAGSQPDSLHVISRAGASVAPLIVESSSTHFLELRNANSGSDPTKVLGSLQFGITSGNPTELIWFSTGTKSGRERFIGTSDWTIEGHTNFTQLRARNQTIFADSVLSTLFEVGDAGSGADSPSTLTGRRVLMSSAGGNILARLGISATSVIIGSAIHTALPAPVSSALLTIAASATPVVTVGSTGAMTMTPSTDVVSLTINPNSFGQTSDIFRVSDGSGNFNFRIDGVGDPFFGSGTGVYTFFNGPSGASGVGTLDFSALTAARSFSFPNTAGGVLITAATQTFTNKTGQLLVGSTLISSTSSSGVSFTDITTATKKLRVVLSGAVGDNSFTLTNTAARNYGLGNLSGNVVVVGDDPPAVASGNLGKVDLTAQTAAIGATALSSTPGAGLYRVSWYLAVTTADAGAGTVQFQINYTDVVGATNQTGAALALTATNRQQGSFVVQLASGDITYQTNVVTIGTAVWAIYVRVESLG